MSPSATGAVRQKGCAVGIGESSAGWVVVSDRDGSDRVNVGISIEAKNPHLSPITMRPDLSVHGMAE